MSSKRDKSVPKQNPDQIENEIEQTRPTTAA